MRHLLPLIALCLSAPAIAAPAADQWHATGRAILAHAVSVRTAAGQNKVPELAAWLRARFIAAGVRADAITTLPVEDTAAMVVRIEGRDKTAKPILISSHLDIVDANPKDWTRDPFTLVEEKGYFFGRGVADDKVSVAQMAVTIERLAQSGKRPSRTLIFAFIGDEETSMHTTMQLAGARRDLIDAEFEIESDSADGVLDDEGRPLAYFVSASEKTYADFELTVRNPGGHSASPRADNAIYELADALQKVRAYRFPAQSNAITRSSLVVLGKVTPGPTGKAMLDFAANPVEGAAADLLSANPELVGQLRTTCVATMLSGGHATNALPQSASANVNCRIFPGTGVEQVRTTLSQLVGPGVGVALTGDPPVESLVSPPNAAVMAAITKAVHQHYPGVPIGYSQPSGGSDALHFRRAGIPSYGSSGWFLRPRDDFMHGLDERIPVDSFYNAIDYMWTLVGELAPLG